MNDTQANFFYSALGVTRTFSYKAFWSSLRSLNTTEWCKVNDLREYRVCVANAWQTRYTYKNLCTCIKLYVYVVIGCLLDGCLYMYIQLHIVFTQTRSTYTQNDCNCFNKNIMNIFLSSCNIKEKQKIYHAYEKIPHSRGIPWDFWAIKYHAISKIYKKSTPHVGVFQIPRDAHPTPQCISNRHGLA